MIVYVVSVWIDGQGEDDDREPIGVYTDKQIATGLAILCDGQVTPITLDAEPLAVG